MTSTFGRHAHNSLREAPDWPDTTQWLERIIPFPNHLCLGAKPQAVL